MSEPMTADLAVEAVTMAVWNRWPKGGVIHHSDHGSQYTALILGKALRKGVYALPWAALVMPTTMPWQKGQKASLRHLRRS